MVKICRKRLRNFVTKITPNLINNKNDFRYPDQKKESLHHLNQTKLHQLDHKKSHQHDEKKLQNTSIALLPGGKAVRQMEFLAGSGMK